MATDDYTADSAFLLPFPPMLVWSNVTSGCAIVPGFGCMANVNSRSTIITSIG
ncbi:hypothetical protein [Bradyrhizobium sp. LMG 9283]|uniref:hypothetical protein n=1 Tax=Bradyrhizobium sp. LMG 9283 TaxID=592064 RepID=UPI00388DBD6B